MTEQGPRRTSVFEYLVPAVIAVFPIGIGIAAVKGGMAGAWTTNELLQLGIGELFTLSIFLLTLSSVLRRRKLTKQQAA